MPLIPLNIIITNLVTLFVAWLAFAGSITTNKDDELKVAFDRMYQLEERVGVTQADLISCQADNMVMQQDLRVQLNPTGLLSAYMDALPEPAWLKEVVEEPDSLPTFRMMIVNRAYERKYEISRLLYEGQDDFSVWDNETATQFYSNDMKAFERKTAVMTKESFEPFPGAGYTIDRYMWKFTVPLPGGSWGVGGIVMDTVGGIPLPSNETPKVPVKIPGKAVIMGRSRESENGGG